MSKYKLENNLYQQFRFEIAKIISKVLKSRNSIKKYTKEGDLIIKIKSMFNNIIPSIIIPIHKKKIVIEKIIMEIVNSDSFYFDKDNKIDIHLNFNKKTRRVCSSNKKPERCSILNLCTWIDNKCSFYIPENNLSNPKKKNKKKYVDLLVEEIIRNNVKRNEIMNGTVPELISHSINPKEIIITDDNYESEIDKLYNLNDNILYDNNYPVKGYDNYFIDDKFQKKPVPHKCLGTLKDSFIYNDLPQITQLKDITPITMSKIVSQNEQVIKNKILEMILKKGYRNLLKKYSSITFKDYHFIKNEQDFRTYFNNEHYLNLYDLDIFSQIYNLNLILFYEEFSNYIDLFEYNKSEQYSIILVIKKMRKGHIFFLNYLILKEHNFLFKYDTLSPNLRRLINIRREKRLLVPKLIANNFIKKEGKYLVLKKKSSKRTSPKIKTSRKNSSK